MLAPFGPVPKPSGSRKRVWRKCCTRQPSLASIWCSLSVVLERRRRSKRQIAQIFCNFLHARMRLCSLFRKAGSVRWEPRSCAMQETLCTMTWEWFRRGCPACRMDALAAPKAIQASRTRAGASRLRHGRFSDPGWLRRKTDMTKGSGVMPENRTTLYGADVCLYYAHRSAAAA